MSYGKTNITVAPHSTFYTNKHINKILSAKSLNENGIGNHMYLISLGTTIAIVGFLLSGPVGFLFVQFINPQPKWDSAVSNVAQYSLLQNIPYYFGFILASSVLILAVSNYMNAERELPLIKMLVLLSVIWIITFTAFVLFNHICQIAFIQQVVVYLKHENDTVINMLNMANQASLSWTIEMCGYASLE